MSAAVSVPRQDKSEPKPKRRRKRSTKPRTAKQAASAKKNLRPVKRGGAARNPEGRNGLDVAREKVAKLLAASAPELTEVLMEVARLGNVRAIDLALQAVLPPAPKQQIEVSGSVAVTTLAEAALARRKEK